MSTRLFVLVVEGDVFNKIIIPHDIPIAERYYAGLSSNPIFVDCNGLDVKIHSIWDGTHFYASGDIEKTNPIIDIDERDIDGKAQFALVVEEEVFGKITLAADDPNFEIFKAGMSSNPVCIESTDYPMVDVGWTWDGSEFHPPVRA
jgi:hypothetical protein